MLHGLPNGTGVTGVGGSLGARHSGSLTVMDSLSLPVWGGRMA
jgi:hypothetical protein